MDRRILRELKQIVGAEHLATTPEDLVSYSYDASGLEFVPEAVVFPGSVGEVGRIMRLASRSRFPVVPRGAGTGMTGGSLAVQGGLIMVMSRFNRILEIDRQNQVAMVEPGVITGEFQAAAKKLGLYYPPDPASLNFCTIGGNVANCAGGPSAVKYGVTRDYVLGLEVVLADGSIIHTGVRTAKGVVGYDLTRLFVGSEGTLGIITRITLRLLTLPRARCTFLVTCASLAGATGLVAEILTSGILPCTLEYMDHSALAVVNSHLPEQFGPEVAALLLIELDGDSEAVAGQGRRLGEMLANRALFPEVLEVKQATGKDDIEALWAARRAISPASFQLKPNKISEDVVVPRTRIPELVSFTETLAGECRLPILTFGHAGDGNIHVNIMLDRDDPEELERGLTAKKRLFNQVLALGGTISGEHGVGLAKAEFMGLEIDAATLAVMRAIKQALDPHHILNPGKGF